MINANPIDADFEDRGPGVCGLLAALLLVGLVVGTWLLF